VVLVERARRPQDARPVELALVEQPPRRSAGVPHRGQQMNGAQPLSALVRQLLGVLAQLDQLGSGACAHASFPSRTTPPAGPTTRRLRAPVSHRPPFGPGERPPVAPIQKGLPPLERGRLL